MHLYNLVRRIKISATHKQVGEKSIGAQGAGQAWCPTLLILQAYSFNTTDKETKAGVF